MNTRAKHFVMAGSLAAVLVAMMWRPQASSSPPVPPSTPVLTTPAATPTNDPSMSRASAAPAQQDLVTHAVEIARLNGFPPDAVPGDVFDVWVAWNPPIVKEPNIQLLLKSVRLEKIAPPVTADGPYVAFLLLHRRDARELLYATRYGALSVTQPVNS